jgi:sugar O-acyltransferase (sialic acid O-acetyltransferase NeuD family)
VEQLSSPSKRTEPGAENSNIVCGPGRIEPTLHGRMDKRMTAIYGIYGASGFGREVMPLLQEQVTKNNETGNSIVFIDDNSEHERSNGYPVISFESFWESPADQHHVSIAISNSRARQTIEKKCIDHDVNLLSLRAQNAIILDEVRIGRGSIICPFTTLTSNITVGKQFQANIYSYVAHDCVIGDYVTFAPSVKCNGNVVIDEHAYIGTGAIIKQGQLGKPLRIGKGAIVAAGSFVNKDIPDGMTVFGSPAIELTKDNLRKRNG